MDGAVQAPAIAGKFIEQPIDAVPIRYHVTAHIADISRKSITVFIMIMRRAASLRNARDHFLGTEYRGERHIHRLFIANINLIAVVDLGVVIVGRHGKFMKGFVVNRVQGVDGWSSRLI